MVDEVSSNPIPKGKLPPALELLRNLERWVIWRWQNGENGERTKPLYQARYPDKYAENNNVHTWATYDEAVAAAAKDDTIAGVGLVLTGSNLVAFDIDDCRDDKTGKIHAWAKDLIERAGSYAEVTVSGTGVRIIGHGTGPKPNRTKLPVPKSKGMTCEFYRKAVRYITMTGNQIGEPKPVVNLDKIFDQTYAELIKHVGSDSARQVDLDDLIKNGRYELFLNEEGKPDKSRAVWRMIKLAILEGWNNDEIVETLLDKNNKISEHIYTAHPENPKRYAREQVEKRRKKLEARIVPVVNHMRRARLFRDQRRPNLRHWRGDFYDWIDGSHYQEIEKDTIIAEIWKYLDQALCRNDKEKIVPFYPQIKFVNETFAALKAISQMRDNLETPFWIEGGVGGELIAFPNGLLDLDIDNKLYPSNPNYFTLGALGFNYQPKGGEPKEWLKFLDQIFDKQNNAAEAKAQIDALQEIFGYLLTGDISQEKCFLWLGPPRSGKGTLGNMIKALLAATAVVGPKLSDFGTEFGLSLLIGRQVAVIDDLRVGRGEQNLMVENVLKITGRGLFSINRKYKPFWTGLLPVKLVFISNKMPQLGDDSPALASRFIILETRQSFLGREDPDLFETKLRPELVDVFHWAMDGLRRLRGRGKFAEPQTSAEARERMANLGSLVMAFITDRCELKPEAYANKQRLYNAYKEYAAENDMPPDTYEKFYEALYAATGGKVRTARPTDKETGKQVRTIQGITLRSEQKQERQTSMYDRLDGPPPHDPDDPGPEGCYH